MAATFTEELEMHSRVALCSLSAESLSDHHQLCPSHCCGEWYGVVTAEFPNGFLKISYNDILNHRGKTERVRRGLTES